MAPRRSLRRRILTAKSALGIHNNNVALDLRTETLINYKLKLQPILSQEYYDRILRLQDSENPGALPKSTAALKHTLHVPIVTVTNLTVQPGEPNFILWLLISSFFPLVAACMAPLGNLISLIGLVEHWRIIKATGQSIPDKPPVFGLNIASFVLGIVGNASLLMNFSGKMKYLVTQCVSIFFWVVAATFLLIGVVITSKGFLGPDPEYRPSEGFWLAVFTIFMYYCCSLILIINFVGYKLNKYPPTFNLDHKQRRLMSYTIAFSVWQGIGSLTMTQLIKDMTYGASLYYCTVSMLTIGLGDIIPLTPGAKVYTLIFTFIGVIIMGLIVATIRQVVLSSAGPSIFWHLVEKRRVKLLDHLHRANQQMTSEESFRTMRLLRANVRLHQTNFSLAISCIFFLLFWLVGAAIFHYCEGWNFFNSVYFCFLCLLTIGYGDFHPVTAFGRVFFIQWAITAIPLMTILISNAGDKLYELADGVDTIASFLLNWRNWFMAFKWSLDNVSDQNASNPNLNKTSASNTSDSVSNLDVAVLDETLEGSEVFVTESDYTDVQRDMIERHRASHEILDRFNALRVVMFDTLDDPGKRYSLDEWTDALQKLQTDDSDQLADPEFWLGELSPLRLPIKEPNYILLKMFFRIEKDLHHLIQMQKEAWLRLDQSGRKLEEVSSETTRVRAGPHDSADNGIKPASSLTSAPY